MASHNHNGSSFIEMMAALALLTFFGTSIFLVQNNVFTRLIKTHDGVQRMFVLPEYFLQFDEKLIHNQNPLQLTIQDTPKNIHALINMSIKPFQAESAIGKKFGNFCGLNVLEIEQDNKKYFYYRFIFTKPRPEEQKKDKKEKSLKTPEAKNVPSNK